MTTDIDVSDIEVSKQSLRFYVLTEHLNETTAKGIHDKLRMVWGDKTSNYTTITRWIAEFSSGKQTKLDDSIGSNQGRPTTSSTEDNNQ